MSGARVNSVDALKHFRVALFKFGEVANVAMGDAEGEIQRVVMWLGHEQQQYWSTQIRKRQELVARCKEAVRQKKLFKDSSGRTQTAVDEEKQLAKAMRNLEAAEQKLVATKKHYTRLQKEMHMYKGSVQRLMTAVTSDIPEAAHMLDRMVVSIEGYLELTGPVNEQPVVTVEGAESMSHGEMDPALEGPQGEGVPAEREGLPSEESREEGLKEADVNAEKAPPQGAAATEAPVASETPPP